MTYDTYEKATDLMGRMDYLSRIECLLENACKGKYLATIGECTFENELRICVKDCKVLNHEVLENDIRERLLRVIRDEHSKVVEEFKAL